jgi:hypothetical protein
MNESRVVERWSCPDAQPNTPARRIYDDEPGKGPRPAWRKLSYRERMIYATAALAQYRATQRSLMDLGEYGRTPTRVAAPASPARAHTFLGSLEPAWVIACTITIGVSIAWAINRFFR